MTQINKGLSLALQEDHGLAVLEHVHTALAPQDLIFSAVCFYWVQFALLHNESLALEVCVAVRDTEVHSPLSHPYLDKTQG